MRLDFTSHSCYTRNNGTLAGIDTQCHMAETIPVVPAFTSHKISSAEVAQLAEHSPEKAGVDSSILSLGTI